MVLIACGAAGLATQNLDILRLCNGSQKLVLVSRRLQGYLYPFLFGYTLTRFVFGQLMEICSRNRSLNAKTEFVVLYSSELSVE